MERVRINKLELASNLAEDATKDELYRKGVIVSDDELYVDSEAETLHYTEEAQDVFNDFYNYFMEAIEKVAE